MLGAGRHNFPAVVVGLGHIADLKEGHYIAVEGTGLGAVVVRKGSVEEDIRAAEDLGYEEEEPHTAVEGGDNLVVEDMDYVKELRMVAVAAVDTLGYTDPAPHMLPAVAMKEVVDLVHILRTGARIREEVGQPHHSPAGVDNPGTGILEEDTGSAEAADTLLSRH